MNEKLCVVMPVYNEREAIGGVLKKWATALDALGIDYVIRPYNDGSKDDSLAVMHEAAKNLAHVEVRDKPNGGHGPTILQGYREASADGFEWAFQIDSDDEMGPDSFAELWNRRNDHDFLVGRRASRRQALPRKIVSFISRLAVRMFYGKSTVWDVNAPYRLMRVSAFQNVFANIPTTTFAPNVIITGMAAKLGLRAYEMPVPQHDRTTGEVSIKKWKLLKAAVKSLWQTVLFALSQWTAADWLRAGMYGFMLLVAIVMLPLALHTPWCRDASDWLLDFQWDPAKILVRGENPYLYTLEGRTFMGQIVHGNQVPSCLLLLTPWTLIPIQFASKTWVASNLFFTCMCLFYIRRIWFADDIRRPFGFAFVALALFSMGCTHNLLSVGQHLLFSLAFFFAGYHYAQQGRTWLSGIMVAFSLFKYTTIFPLLLIFIVLRQYKPLIIAAAIHIALTVFAGIWTGYSPVVLILQSFEVSNKLLLGEGIGDIASVLHMCGVADYGSYAIYGYAFFSVLFLLVAFTGRKDPLLKLSIFAVGSNFMFYHRGYDLVVWIIPLIYATLLADKRDWKSRVIVAITFACVAFCCYTPVRLVRSICPCLLNPYLFLGFQYVWLVVLIATNWDTSAAAKASKLHSPVRLAE